MLLAYLDESYSSSWNEYWIAAVICPDTAVDPLTTDLNLVVANAIEKYGLNVSDQTELHGHLLYQGKGEWSSLRRMTRARIDIYAAALEAIAAYEVQIVARGVDVQRLARRSYSTRWHPHKIALQYVLEDVDVVAARSGQPALVIADEISSAVEHRRELWEYQRSPTPGYRSRTLTHIVDTMHFAPSTASRLVQAADLVAFLRGRIQSGLDSDNRAIQANRELWDLIHPRVYNMRCWYP